MLNACLILALATSASEAERKIWLPKVTLNDVNLWSEGHMPCPGQKASMPSEAAVHAPLGWTVLGSELELPSNGMLAFPQSSGLAFLSSDSLTRNEMQTECRKKANGHAFFHLPPFSLWHDPHNWGLEGGRVFSAAIPHLRRLPCRDDEAVFPANGAYKVGISERVEIGRIRVNGRVLDEVGFRSLYLSRIGSMMFQVNASVAFHQGRCIDPAGCECGTMASAEAACAAVKCNSRPPLCTGAVKPREHCCYDVCGAIVHLEAYDDLPRLSVLQDVARLYTRDSQPPDGGQRQHFATDGKRKERTSSRNDVAFTVSRVGRREYELIFVDEKGDIENSIDVARDVAGYLRRDAKGENYYVWVEESGTSPPSAWRAAAEVLGALTILAVVLALIYLLNGVYAKRHIDGKGIFSGGGMPSISAFRARMKVTNEAGEGSFAFSRFSNDQNEEIGQVEMVSEPRVEVLDSATMTMKRVDESEEVGATGRSFVNPMYNDGQKTLDASAAALVGVQEETSVDTPVGLTQDHDDEGMVQENVEEVKVENAAEHLPPPLPLVEDQEEADRDQQEELISI